MRKSESHPSMEMVCMSDTIKDYWVEAYSVWLGMDSIDDDIDDITAFGDILLIAANLNSCEIRKPWRDIHTFC